MSVDGQIRAIIEREKGSALHTVRGGADPSRDTLKKLSDSLDGAVDALTDTTPPAVPTGLAGASFVETGSDGAVRPRLSARWDANAEPDLAYYVLSITRDAGDPVVHHVEGTYWEGAAREGSTYALKIKAADGHANKSAFSAAVTVTPSGDVTPPGAVTPDATRPLIQKAGALVLKGEVPADSDFDRIEVYRNSISASGSAVLAGTHKGLPYRDDDVAIGDTWFYWARAVDRSGNRGALAAFGSHQVIDVNDVTAPGTPSLFTPTQSIAFDNDGHQVCTVALEWVMAAEADFKRYDVAVNKGAGWHSRAITPDAGDTPRIEVEALVGATVQFKVRAVDNSNNKSALATASLVVGGDTTAPGVVTATSAASRPRGVVLKAVAPADKDFAGVQVYRHTANVAASASALDFVAGRPGKKLWYRDDDVLSVGASYWYWMAAIDSQGNESATRTLMGAGAVVWAGIKGADLEDNAVDIAGTKVTGKSLINLDPTRDAQLGVVIAPSPNLLYNGNFRLGLKKWASSEAGTPNAANWSLGTVGNGPYIFSNSVNQTLWSRRVGVTVGQVYTISWEMERDATCASRLVYSWFDASDVLISSDNVNRFNETGAIASWVQRKLVTVASPAGAVYLRFQVVNDNSGSGYSFWRRFKVEARSNPYPVFTDDVTDGARYDDGTDHEALKPAAKNADVTSANTSADTAKVNGTASATITANLATALANAAEAVDDSTIKKTEKKSVVPFIQGLLNEQASLDAQATAQGITTEKTAYDGSISTLTAYLATLTTPVAWNNFTGKTTVSGTTLNADLNAVATARAALLAKLSGDASTKAIWGPGITGAGKPADNATKTITYRAGMAPTGGTYATGDRWIDTSATPRVTYAWTGTAWEAIGRNVTLTSHLSDAGALSRKDTASSADLEPAAATPSIIGPQRLSGLILDPNFLDPNYWGCINGAQIVTGTSGPTGMGCKAAFQGNAALATSAILRAFATRGNFIPAEPSATYSLDAISRVTAGFSGRVEVAITYFQFDGTASAIKSSDILGGVDYTSLPAGATANEIVSGFFTTPLDCDQVNVTVRINFGANYPATSSGIGLLGRLTINRMPDRSARTDVSNSFSGLQTLPLFSFGPSTPLTIASDAVTATASYCSIDTEGGASTDNLSTINGGTGGSLLVLKPISGARVITVKRGTGNIALSSAGDFVMNNPADRLVLLFQGTQWVELSRSDNS
jgi:hypothetical protein